MSIVTAADVSATVATPILLNNVTVIPYNGCSYSSYNAISRSEVVISHISTLGYESYNFKTKVMFFQPYSFMYKIPENFNYIKAYGK